MLKATDVHPLGYPTVEAIVRMGAKLEKATGGRYSIQMFPSMQLGGEKEMIEQAQVGALQIARISVGPMGPIVDELNVFNMPFVFRDEAHMRKVIDGPIGTEMLEKLTNSSARLVALGWMDAGTRNVYSDKPVTKPADLKGMKIRMMGNPVFVETMNAMGGNGIAMGFNELHQALQSGVVDGAENNEPTLFAQNHYQTPRGKVYSLTGHLIIPEIFVFSKASWDKLPKADQDLIRKLSREAQLEQRQLWDAYVGEATAKLKAAGIKFVPADKEAFFKATQPVRDKYGVEVRRADPAHPGHQVAVFRNPTGRRGRRPFFCHETELSPGDGKAVPRLHRDFRHGAGRDHADHSGGGVHALRHEQSNAMAGACLGDHDGDFLLRRRRRRRPRERADRRRGADQGGRPEDARGDHPGSTCVHAAHRCLHVRLRRAPVPAHLGQHHGRVSAAVGRHRLHADPDRRRAARSLFIVEKIWLGEPPRTDVMYSDQAAELE